MTISLSVVYLRFKNPRQEVITLNFINHLLKTLVCKYFFSIRIISNWNILPYKVLNAASLAASNQSWIIPWKINLCFNKNFERSKQRMLYRVGEF